MNAQDILDMIGDAKGSYVWDAQQVRSGLITTEHRKIPARKLWLIAAVIALALLLVGCAVVYVLSLQDMKIGEKTITKQEHYGPNWVVIEETQITYDVLSVQSFSDSPNQQATREWQAYTDSFDPYDLLEIPDEVRLSVPDAYSNFGCWSPEMMEKLDEIAQKHGLKLMGENIGTNQEYVTVLLDTFNLPDLLRPQPYADTKISSVGIYQHSHWN